MNALAKLTWLELKLFVREPITLIFTFALPLITLFVMGGVFGNTPGPEGEIYRGVGPMDYYTPAYIGLVMAAIGLISLPVHLASYREQGVLRRFRASAVSIWSVLGSQLIVTFVMAVVCAVLLTVAAALAYDIHFPKSVGLLVPAFILGTLSFAALGVLLGALLPTARAAQGLGLLLFFVMLFLSGAGPPREVMSQALQNVGDATPLKYVIILLQDPWLGFGWATTDSFIVAGIMLVAALLSVRFFRWE